MKVAMMGTTRRIDVILSQAHCASFTRDEWKCLAMASLDQAGVSAADQQTVRILLEVAEGDDGH